MHNLLATFFLKKITKKLFFEVHKPLRLKGQDHNAIPPFYQLLSHLCLSPRSWKTQSTMCPLKHQNSLDLACKVYSFALSTDAEHSVISPQRFSKQPMKKSRAS